jgi:hypothetical protein
MAISVDTIYQRVLALANKEQRGYITPQEYNLLANQAQINIFESYFYSKNLREVIDKDKTNDGDEANLIELLDKKLGPFKSVVPMIVDGSTVISTFPTAVTDGATYDVFQTGKVFLGEEVCQKVSIAEAQRFRKSQRHMATTLNEGPIYTDNSNSGRDIVIYAGSSTPIASGATVECFRVPKTVNWAYVVVGTNKKALYNSYGSVDFELHKSEEDTLVYRILELAGIVINKPGIMQLGAQKAAEEAGLQKI